MIHGAMSIWRSLLVAGLVAGLTGLSGCDGGGEDPTPVEPGTPSYGGSGGGGADVLAQVAEDSLAVMEEVVEALASVQDEASAEAAAERIEGLAERIRAMEGRFEALDMSPEELRMRMQALAAEGEFAEREQQIRTGMMQHSMRVMVNPAFAEHLGPAMAKLQPAGAPPEPPAEPLLP